MFELFEFNGNDLTLNVPEILLVKEFNDVWNNTDWGSCADDEHGDRHVKAERFFRYMWLTCHYKSPYWNQTERERRYTALDDTGLKAEDVDHPLAVAATKKYLDMLDFRLLKLFRTGSNTVDKIREFLDSIDLFDMDTEGNYKHDVAKVMKQVSDLGKVSEGLELLEFQVKKQMESKKSVRGEDTELGAFD